MKTIEVNLYKFSELSKDAKRKAVEKEMTLNSHDDIYGQMVTESMLEACGYNFGLDVGLPHGNKKHDLIMEYSLSYSQGDGVALYGVLYKEEILKMLESIKKYNDSLESEKFTYIDDELIKEIEALPILKLEIDRNHYGNHYTHINCMEFEITMDDSELDNDSENYDHELESLEVKALELQPQFKDIFRYIVNFLESYGYRDYEYYSSEEFAKEELLNKDDEQYFTEDGKFHSWA